MMPIKLLTTLLVLTAMAGCATSQTADNCSVNLTAPLRSAMSVVEERLASRCGNWYEGYVKDLVDIAEENPDPDNRRAFSDFLVALADRGVISRRQASDFYNRYFNIKFVSLSGDYSTGSQVCPVREKVLLEMRQELLDKETGLLRVSGDADSYYRADLLQKEAEMVLEATCRAAVAGQTTRAL